MKEIEEPSCPMANVTADNKIHITLGDENLHFPFSTSRFPCSAHLCSAPLAFASPTKQTEKAKHPTPPHPTQSRIATGGSKPGIPLPRPIPQIDSAARPSVHGSVSRATSSGMATMDISPPTSTKPAPDLGSPLPSRIRGAALLLLVSPRLRPRLVLLLRLVHLLLRPGVARGAVRLRHVRRGVRAALHGCRAGRGGARHARHLDHRPRAARLRGTTAPVARRRGPTRHQGHRGARAPRPAA